MTGDLVVVPLNFAFTEISPLIFSFNWLLITELFFKRARRNRREGRSVLNVREDLSGEFDDANFEKEPVCNGQFNATGISSARIFGLPSESVKINSTSVSDETRSMFASVNKSVF
jgi:hypothetical protein